MQMNLATECNQIHRHTMDMAKFNKDIEFSNRFRKLVADKGWSELNRIDLGKKIGTSSTCATFYMNGDRLPAIDQARIISKLFDVCVEWLLTGKGPMRPGEEIADPLYKELMSLTPEQRNVIELMIKQLNNTEKPLTTDAPNAGGGAKSHNNQNVMKRDSGFCDDEERRKLERRVEESLQKKTVLFSEK